MGAEKSLKHESLNHTADEDWHIPAHCFRNQKQSRVCIILLVSINPTPIMIYGDYFELPDNNVLNNDMTQYI